MGNVNKKPGPFRVGQKPPGVRELQQIADATWSQITPDDTLEVTRVHDKMMIGVPRKDIKAEQVFSQPALFIIFAVFKDWLECVPFCHNAGDDPDNTLPKPVQYGSLLFGQEDKPQEHILVAKPNLLQQSYWDDQTVNYNGINIHFKWTGIDERQASAVIGGIAYSEIQKVTPPYFVGDVISAYEGITQLNGGEAYGKKCIMWTDLNEAGRAWAAECP